MQVRGRALYGVLLVLLRCATALEPLSPGTERVAREMAEFQKREAEVERERYSSAHKSSSLLMWEAGGTSPTGQRAREV